MRSRHAAPRVVLDTNVVLSALIFSRGRMAELRSAWQDGRIVPLVSAVTAAELIRVLAYPKFRLESEEQADLLAEYVPWCETVRVSEPPPRVPACRDPFDLPFLQLAKAAGVEFVVTGDSDLLAVEKRFIHPIVTADQFLKALGARR